MPKKLTTRLNSTVCVGAVVVRDGQVLLVRQAPGHDLEGMWTFPWGFVDVGEAPADAAIRETLEEAGVHVEIEGVLGVQDLPERGSLGIVFLCRFGSGDVTPDGREVDQAGFFGATDIERLSDTVEPWSAWVVRRVLGGRHAMLPTAPDTPYAPRIGFF